MITKNNALRINCSTIKEFKEKHKNIDFIFSFLDVKEYYDWDYSCYFEFKYPVLGDLDPSIIMNDNLCNQNYKPTILYWNWGFTEKKFFKIPELKKCEIWEIKSECCSYWEYNYLMIQRFLEKNKDNKDFLKLLETWREKKLDILQKMIEIEDSNVKIYWKIYRDFKIISQEEYDHLKVNWEIKEQTTIFIFIFFILLIFLKSFKKIFLKKGKKF